MSDKATFMAKMENFIERGMTHIYWVDDNRLRRHPIKIGVGVFVRDGKEAVEIADLYSANYPKLKLTKTEITAIETELKTNLSKWIDLIKFSGSDIEKSRKQYYQYLKVA